MRYTKDGTRPWEILEVSICDGGQEIGLGNEGERNPEQ